MISQGKDLSHIYKLRKDFTIIGLTGQLGSGCTEVAGQLAKGFDDGTGFTNPVDIFRNNGSQFSHNAYRKHRIVYDYAKVNFKPYTVIEYKDVLTLFLLKYKLVDLKSFLESPELGNEFSRIELPKYDFSKEIENISSLNEEFEYFSNLYNKIEIDKIKDNDKWITLYDFFFGIEFKTFSEKIHNSLSRDADLKGTTGYKANSGLSYHKAFQVISNNLRKSAHPFKFDNFNPDKIFTISETINKIIKAHRKKYNDIQTQIVIDSLKNPLEILFFKQRYGAFYAIAINRNPDELDLGRFTTSKSDGHLDNLMKEEYEGGGDSDFFRQKISQCLQLADIHISFLSDFQVEKENKKIQKDKEEFKINNTTPFFGWKDQLLKYVSLIDHPGLITPSPEERCMQLAYTAKHNSGCISRHVGAAITDENYSIKAIGWNNTPEGQVPCVLRNTDDLLNNRFDVDSFTDYERDPDNKKFKQVLEDNFRGQIELEQQKLKGRTVCFCFKSLKNSFSEGQNQVHTRSLHAEESAFLQLSKYGGVGILGGKLFSTASPCELCAKKARQLGIKEIYYIDPYPGISNSHILNTGINKIKPKLFNGAIGSAYHWLYDPIMPYKDELKLLLGHDIRDQVKKLEKENVDLEKENKKLKEEIKRLSNLK